MGNLFSWTVVGILVPILIGVGVGVMSMTPPEYWIAKICFSVAALLLLAKIVVWIISTQSSLGDRIIIAFLLFGIIGVGWVESLQCVVKRSLRIGQLQNAPAQ